MRSLNRNRRLCLFIAHSALLFVISEAIIDLFDLAITPFTEVVAITIAATAIQVMFISRRSRSILARSRWQPRTGSSRTLKPGSPASPRF